MTGSRPFGRLRDLNCMDPIALRLQDDMVENKLFFIGNTFFHLQFKLLQQKIFSKKGRFPVILL